MSSYQNKFLEFMLTKGLNVTRQRLRIYEIFLGMHGHHTLEDIFLQVHKVEPGIGQTTVYRTLKLLSEADLAHELQFGDGVARFEPMVSTVHHDHLVCQGCGQTIEVHSDEIESIQKKIAIEHGYKLLGHAHFLYGLCLKCQERDQQFNVAAD